MTTSDKDTLIRANRKLLDALTMGYWWVENYSDVLEKPIQRIIEIAVLPTDDYLAGRWHKAGTYRMDDHYPAHVYSMDEWEQLRLERVTGPSFASHANRGD